MKKKLVCFDFDGLLVDTEPLHHMAYTILFKRIGVPIYLNFKEYCALAHSPNRNLFKESILKTFPDFSHDWTEIRKQKKIIYIDLLTSKSCTPMPGSEALIDKLLTQKINLCIVTNSERFDLEKIEKNLPFLKKIQVRFTREDYTLPKPSPDGYLKALDYFNVLPEEAIGLEDTKKGINALNDAFIPHLFINQFINKETENEFHSLLRILEGQ